MSNFDRMRERYIQGSVPWDDADPPPEVAELIPQLKPGLALDLGCGYGRASILMAQHGWQVDGIDFIPEAVDEAATRAEQVGVSEKVCFHEASVAQLDFLTGAYDFALDVGCMHNIGESNLANYAAGLRRLLRQGAIYLLYARLAEPGHEPENGPRGLPQAEIKMLFNDGFELMKFVPGETVVEDMPIWQSAWFYFRRTI